MAAEPAPRRGRGLRTHRIWKNPMVMLLVVLGLSYLVVCTYILLRQRSLIYYGDFTRTEAASTDFALARGDVTLRGWVVNPGGGDPILYFGGNGERVELSREEFAAWFPGRTVYLLAYRGYGASDGVPEEEALIADAVAFYDHVRARHPGQPISAIGRSLGSGIASQLASRRALDRLALVTPFDRMASPAKAHYPWLPVDWLLQERYDSVQALAAHRGSVLIVQAGRDTVIPASSTQALRAALGARARHLMLAEADHNSIDDLPDYGQTLADYLR
jgi:uncharacterized protein